MQDPIPIPACFSSGARTSDDLMAATRSGQSIVTSVYRTKIAGQCRSITVTWCKNLLVHGLSVSIEGCNAAGGDDGGEHYICKVELRPWYFWRKHGGKRFKVGGTAVDVFWDLKAAKFGKEPEPQSDYYVAVVCNDEVTLLLGDLKNEAYRKTGSRPSLIDAILVSKTEHTFGKRRFSTRTKFSNSAKTHEILIECNTSRSSSSRSQEARDPEMAIKIDGHLAIHVKHLQWKFRGNESIHVNKIRVEVYWDVHDWLFSPGLRHALFIFKPSLPSLPSASIPSSSCSFDLAGSGGPSDFCLFVHAWKIE